MNEQKVGNKLDQDTELKNVFGFLNMDEVDIRVMKYFGQCMKSSATIFEDM